ncbi:MAG: YraN family protein [Selenomonadaceae bacterium]|nr:YraN family protein [Selenomonadaceae bacterium]
MDSKELGRCGEKLAADYFSSHGYSLLESNYRCRFGELDLIARRGDMVVFAEVKTRRSGRFGRPGGAVDYFKQQRIIRGAKWYIRSKGLENNRFRFDVLEILRTPAGQMCINHIKGAFEA